ncbi:hypothetical protein L195_g019605, partial [Trifolium pratense]
TSMGEEAPTLGWHSIAPATIFVKASDALWKTFTSGNQPFTSSCDHIAILSALTLPRWYCKLLQPPLLQASDRIGEVYVSRNIEVQQRSILTSVVTNLVIGMMRWQKCGLCEGERIGEFESIKGESCCYSALYFTTYQCSIVIENSRSSPISVSLGDDVVPKLPLLCYFAIVRN